MILLASYEHKQLSLKHLEVYFKRSFIIVIPIG